MHILNFPVFPFILEPNSIESRINNMKGLGLRSIKWSTYWFINFFFQLPKIRWFDQSVWWGSATCHFCYADRDRVLRVIKFQFENTRFPCIIDCYLKEWKSKMMWSRKKHNNTAKVILVSDTIKCGIFQGTIFWRKVNGIII